MGKGGEWWRGKIERLAYTRLLGVRRSGLWNGRPPVPVDHVIEQALRLTITYDVIEEDPDEEILGCLRPAAREIVLNERHIDRFKRNPGVERFTKGHEAGHADVFAASAIATEQVPIFPATIYHPRQKSAMKGPVSVLGIRLAEKLRGRSREVKFEVMRLVRERERERYIQGQDTPLERRAVDHYAAVLLMPEDVVRATVTGHDLSHWSTIRQFAEYFEVSVQAFRIRLEELGLIYGVDDSNQILLTNPAEEGQLRLL
jgi:hypothetical protein